MEIAQGRGRELVCAINRETSNYVIVPAYSSCLLTHSIYDYGICNIRFQKFVFVAVRPNHSITILLPCTFACESQSGTRGRRVKVPHYPTRATQGQCRYCSSTTGKTTTTT